MQKGRATVLRRTAQAAIDDLKTSIAALEEVSNSYDLIRQGDSADQEKIEVLTDDVRRRCLLIAQFFHRVSWTDEQAKKKQLRAS